jgi:hypothetical protein
MGVSRGRKLLVAAIALTVTACACMIVIELWVRMRWDDTQGQPGFFLTDARRGQRLSPGYDGWFAGVPVRINSLGFRDRKDYPLDKAPNTFRIIVLGDSVTFGHGTLDETTYPHLLEQQLRAWRPNVNWEVWNLGVPGYNTGQELALSRGDRSRAEARPRHRRFLSQRFQRRQRDRESRRAGARVGAPAAIRATQLVLVRVL